MKAEPLASFVRLCISIALCSIAVSSAQAAEPAYRGKALSEWLLELRRSPSSEEVAAEMQKQQYDLEKLYQAKKRRDEDAIRQIGTNALPTLLQMLGATSENVRDVVGKLQSKELQQAYSTEDARVDRVEDLRSLAVDGFSILETNAQSAVPQITKLFRNPETSFEAARALTKVGPEGFAVLTNSLNDPKDPFRGNAIWVIGQESPADSKTVDRLLIGRLKDQDNVNRHNAATFLKGEDPSAIPALIKMLDDDKNYLAVSGAADGLKRFGPAAKSAAPKLLAIYTNSVVGRDRQAAQSWGVTLMWALKEIDMEAAAQAEAFLVNSGPLNYARNGYTTTLLTNGQELIVGGYLHTEILTVSNRHLSGAELNDPVTGKWKETGAMNTTRDSHTATLLLDGKVLVAGGTDSKGVALSSAEVYDPTIGKWTMTRPLNSARFYHTSALQPDGTVMVAGGHNGSDRLEDTEIYDPAKGAWTAGTTITNLLPVVHSGHTATTLANGKVLIAGGDAAGSAERYDPTTGMWTKTGALKTARAGHTETLLRSGKVLITGGNGSGFYLSTAELYDPATGAWTNTGALTINSIGHTATLLPNAKVLVAGGQGDRGHVARAELYDPATGKWMPTGPLITPRASHTATLLRNGKVLVTGGKNSTFNVLSSVEMYDPVTGKWTRTGELNIPRWRHTATLLSNGKVLVAGGSVSVEATASAELYDPATGKWTETADLKKPRYDHTATLLSNGNVLVAGSIENSDGAPSSAEVYDPATGTWALTKTLAADRSGHTATPLSNGKVLIVGGDAVNRWELYDPSGAK